MKIVLVAANEQPACPYCHDDLGPPTSTCAECGTSCHEECAKLSGRCPLLGCGGKLGATVAAEARLAVVLVPPAQPTLEHEDVLTAAMHFVRWDAQQRLRARVPVILGWMERRRAESVLAALERAKLDGFAIDARALAVRTPFIVRSIVREEDRLLLYSMRREKRALLLAAPRFVVRGRLATVSEKKRSAFDGGDSVEVTKVVRSRDTLRFVHLWLPGEASPIVFEQGELHDYTFLGPKKAASGFENMVLLGDLLATGHPSDSSLESLGDTHISPGGGATYSNRGWVLATSRLIAQAKAPWLAGGARP